MLTSRALAKPVAPLHVTEHQRRVQVLAPPNCRLASFIPLRHNIDLIETDSQTKTSRPAGAGWRAVPVEQTQLLSS